MNAPVNITVTDVQPPSQGKKKGVVKDTNGKYWYVWPDKIYDFQIGKSYNITGYDSFTTDRGTTLHTIRTYTEATSGRQGGVVHSTISQPPQRTTSQPSIGVDENQRRMDIFICGAINNMLSNQNVQPMDLTMMDMVDAIHKFRSAWLAVFGPSPLPRQQTPQRQNSISTGSIAAQQRTIQNNDDMNDEIPF